MADGYGLGGYGSSEPWGSVVLAAPPSEYSLGDFQFSVEARSEGYKIRVKFHAPSVADSPSWARRLIILRKQGEWPQAWDDPGAYTTLNDTFPGEGSYIIDEEDLVAGQIYYYALFMLRDDGVWIHDRFVDRGSAYPYARWGCAEYLWNALPRGWRTADVDQDGSLEDFLQIFGALADDLKTDCENILSLISVDEIHDDLIWVFDKKFAWPTWHSAGGIQRRKETAEAVGVYKLIGTPGGYETALENISGWNCEVVEGWKYVFFSNGLYGSTTPDMSNLDTPRLRGRQEDVLKYTNDSVGWHSVSGLGLFLYEIPGVSTGITGDMLSRFREILSLVTATFVNTGLFIVPNKEEVFPLTRVRDESLDPDYTYSGLPYAVPIEEDLGAETSDAALFMSNAATSLTNTLSDRTFHVALSYV